LQENFDRFDNALYKEKEMADFRRCFITLAVLALLVGTAATVQAAATLPFNCTSSATNVQMRVEGITEKAGDFLLNCTGGSAVAPGTPGQMVNIQVFLNPSNLTSRILNSSNLASEALLLVDEPNEAQQKVCPVGTTCNVLGTGDTTTSPYIVGFGETAPYNVFQGQAIMGQPNTVAFNGVPILAPGTNGGTRIFRITNIRANASQVGLAAGGVPLPVLEIIATSNSSVLPITSNNATQSVGLVQRGLVPVYGTPTIFQQCVNVPFSESQSVILNKGFAAAFKIRNVSTSPTAPLATENQDAPGTVYNTETFFYNNPGITSVIGANAGLADAGTRFRVRFIGVNAGVTVWVPVTLAFDPGIPGTVQNGTPFGNSLYAALTASEVGPFSAVTANGSGPSAGYWSVPLDSSGNGEAVYEVLQANTSSPTENLEVDVFISFTASPGTNSPALTVTPPGPTQIEASFAPISTVLTASSTDPVPRFVDLPMPGPVTHFTITKCATHLLFPFVTNQAGFDTGLAISNTSQDQYMTSTQDGTCTLYFYGTNAPAAVTIPNATVPCPTGPSGATGQLFHGTTCATTASTIAINFQGYVIADCQFQYAHGFAFVTPLGLAPGPGMGYLPLIIPDPALNARVPSPFPLKGPGSGEQLGY
jgi:hypothetical protein